MSNLPESQFLLKAKEMTDEMKPVLMPVIPKTIDLQQPPVGYQYCGGRAQGCTKLIPETEVVYHWTGIVQARDTLCKECQALTPTHALIVCLRCCAVVARMPPHTFPDGFRIEPRKAYHVQYCGNFDCRPDLASSSIIEGQLHIRRNK